MLPVPLFGGAARVYNHRRTESASRDGVSEVDPEICVFTNLYLCPAHEKSARLLRFDTSGVL